MKTLSAARVKRIVKSDYPDFIIKSIKPLKGGWDNFVFEVNKNYIFRFPKKDEFNLNKEIKVLDYLKDKITLEIPHYDLIGKSVPYVAYKKIIGEPLTNKVIKSLTKNELDILARDIANFFSEFHNALPLKLASKFKLRKDGETWRPLIIKKYLLKKITDKSLLDFLKQCLKDYIILRRNISSYIIAFNDLHGENIAYDKKKKRIKGVFDFSDVAIENIDREFSHLFSADADLSLKIVNYYQKISNKKLNVKNIFINAVILEASIMAAYNKKPNSEVYQKSLRNLLRLKDFNIR